MYLIVMFSCEPLAVSGSRSAFGIRGIGGASFHNWYQYPRVVFVRGFLGFLAVLRDSRKAV